MPVVKVQNSYRNDQYKAWRRASRTRHDRRPSNAWGVNRLVTIGTEINKVSPAENSFAMFSLPMFACLCLPSAGPHVMHGHVLERMVGWSKRATVFPSTSYGVDSARGIVGKRISEKAFS